MTGHAGDRWRPGRPVDLLATLGSLRRGSGDPAMQTGADGALWLALRTPGGPATLRLALDPGDAAVESQAWGDGAECAVDAVPRMLGADDDPSGFEPRHPLVRHTWQRHPGWRVPRTGLVLHTLVPTVLEQKVAGAAARASWRHLLRRVGEPAPGPAPAGMRVPPAAATWARVPSWDWHRAGVGPERAATIMRAVASAAGLERTTVLPRARVDAALRSIPGIGAWTSAEVRQRVHGDPDAVSVGDLHLPGLVGTALIGRRVDDAGMLELLAPYAGHRYRAVRMIELSGVRVPRRGPRMALTDYRAI